MGLMWHWDKAWAGFLARIHASTLPNNNRRGYYRVATAIVVYQ
jgi:hypothetical protein